MSLLFSPFSLGPLRLRNRIVIPPMCQYASRDGNAAEWHTIHYGGLALSGAALLILEATAVLPAGRISPADLGLWSDSNEAALARCVAAIRKVSPISLGIQLAHAGRKASVAPPWAGGRQVDEAHGGWQTVAPSAEPFHDTDRAPATLDREGLRQVREAFVRAAQRAERIGLDVIELHAAHGYLLHQFLSPLSNRRTDEYGGSLENRLRFPLEVFDAVRAAVSPRLPVGVRLSATDWVEGGWDVAQSVAFGHALKARGCAFLHVSSGGLSPLQQLQAGPGYQVPLAAELRAKVDLPVIAVGLVTEPRQAEAIVGEGAADLVALGRGMLFNPRWPWHAAQALGAQAEAAPQYLRAAPHGESRLLVAAMPRE